MSDELIEHTKAATELAARLRDWQTDSYKDEWRALPSTIQFDTLWPIAISRQSETNLSAPAAVLLLNLNPQCPLACDTAIKQMLPGWDISIEEVPWYLVRQFGRDVVLAEVERLKTTQPAGEVRTVLNAVLYWARMTVEIPSQKES